MKIVSAGEVREGMVCSTLVYDSCGRHLVKKGAVINAAVKKKLIDSGIAHIYTDEPVFYFSSPFSPETCASTIRAITAFYEGDFRGNGLLKKYGDDEIKKIVSYSGETASKIGFAHLFLYYASELAAQALENREMPYDLRDFRNKSNYDSFHPLGAACLSILIGREMGLNERELCELGAGVMLFDCKMKLYPCSREGRRLTPGEMKEISAHTSAGYDFLKNIYGLPAKAALIASQHHERYDGSGYPKGIRCESINVFSRIAAVADVYDALVSDRPFRNAYTGEEAKGYILENSGVLFAPDVCSAFQKCAVRYMPGTFVITEGGCEAVVIKNNARSPDSPVIKIIEKKGGSDIIFGAETDTAAENSRKIIRISGRGN